MVGPNHVPVGPAMPNPYESPKTISAAEPAGVPTMPIVIDGCLTVADILAARRLMINLYWLRLLVWIAVLGTACVFVFLYLSTVNTFQTRTTSLAFGAIALLFPALVLVRLGVQRFRMVQWARAKAGIFIESRAVFSQEKIETSSAISKSEYSWEAFSGYRAGKTVIVMVSKVGNIHMVIALSKTRSLSDWLGLLALVKSKLPVC